MGQQLALQVLDDGGRIVPNSTVIVTVALTDMSTVFVTDIPVGTPVAIGASGMVGITPIAPSGATPFGQASMIYQPTTGFFAWSGLITNVAERGVWRANFFATNGAAVGTFPPRPIFEVTNDPSGTSINPPTPGGGVTVITVLNSQSPFTVSSGFTNQFILAYSGVATTTVLNLPAAIGSGNTITVKKEDPNLTNVVITANGMDLIDGAPTSSIGVQYATLSYIDIGLGLWARF